MNATTAEKVARKAAVTGRRAGAGQLRINFVSDFYLIPYSPPPAHTSQSLVNSTHIRCPYYLSQRSKRFFSSGFFMHMLRNLSLMSTALRLLWKG